ncbi:hypothetical protein QP168_03755 [Aerococcus urinae]|uniref:Uncharacterized protein n=1 Tax=Aerococcus mictus TaxID=2976810 RepID=A0A1E9PFS7_9LACT|nr:MULTISPECIES: hypothetical protein [Aerococcus]KAA9292193.1 hypothetical protein F6I06_04045 [Aerococcus mictus]MBU5609490.1 hypothetical protein [Aerococcus urinae]MCY3033509.1 hypothetical protein [Aerococcus mictus]MCY3064340.1 hypothetical protein [Aerococcus mictus]MCY3065312.1 hypothetical protein [Aerococcus mictus]
MTGIVFTEEDKRLTVDILGYEFKDLSESDDVFDRNWLKVAFSYSDSVKSFKQVDPCLLSFELGEIIESIHSLISGKKTAVLEKFTEPYLTLAITEIDHSYTFQISFVYDTKDNDWKEVCLCQTLNCEELKQLNLQLKDFFQRYPVR